MDQRLSGFGGRELECGSVSSGNCKSGKTIRMSLRTSRCSNSTPYGRNIGNSIVTVSPENLRIGTRFSYGRSWETGVVRANEGEQAVGTREKSGEKYEEVKGTDVLDSSDAYEMESGSMVQNALAVILLGALGMSAINILAKIGVITIALISVAVRYSMIGILIVVLLCLVG